MRISVLGPVEVGDSERRAHLTGLQRGVIGGLVLEQGRVVSVSRLVDVVWDTHPPKRARAKVQTLIWALRREFKSCDFEDRNEVLLTRAPGYVLADSVAVDLAEFKELTRRGKVALASGEARPASQCFGAALGLWRGHPFADVSSAYISAAAEGIQELHVLALEAKADADLALGDYDSVVTQVSQWLPSYPLRERLRALCMLAMYRLGCRADALNLYRSGREAIVDALGLEPTAELRTLQQRIIADDPALVSRSQRALGGRAASM